MGARIRAKLADRRRRDNAAYLRKIRERRQGCRLRQCWRAYRMPAESPAEQQEIVPWWRILIVLFALSIHSCADGYI